MHVGPWIQRFLRGPEFEQLYEELFQGKDAQKVFRELSKGRQIELRTIHAEVMKAKERKFEGFFPEIPVDLRRILRKQFKEKPFRLETVLNQLNDVINPSALGTGNPSGQITTNPQQT